MVQHQTILYNIPMSLQQYQLYMGEKPENYQQELLKDSLISQQYITEHQHYSPHKQEHIESGEYLKSSVYGGLDGTVNTLVVIIGGIASGTHPSAILALGISVMIGDGLGMGLGDYLSAKSQKQFIKAEQGRQMWQVHNKLEDQKLEVVQIYMDKGYTEEQSRRIADLYATNDQAFVNIMMLEQLGLVVDDSNPFWNGVVTLISFVVFGFLPLIPYLIGYGIKKDDQTQYLIISLVIGGIELFSLGFAKAVLVGLNKIKAGAETLFLGGLAVAMGYLMGMLFQQPAS